MNNTLKNIKVLVLDFDGVLTDNKVLVNDAGDEFVICDKSDSLGIKLLREIGIETMVMTKEKHGSAYARCQKIDIECITGVDDKLQRLKKILNVSMHVIMERHGIQDMGKISLNEVVYVGNDVNDWECIKAVGFGIAVANSHQKLLEIADHITERNGGNGAVREVCDLILESRV